MNRSKKYIKNGFGLKNQVRPELDENYHSALIESIKQNGFCFKQGRLILYLAREFGFCYGVDRAVDLAYQTRIRYPDRRIFLTDEIIHNPRVNGKLREIGVRFLSGPYADNITIQDLGAKDVVIIPAFGASVKELEELEKRECLLVDTTCGSVMSVWKRVESYAQEGLTALIHGKYDHEETLATSSRVLRYPGGKYLVVRNKEEAGKVCDYIRGKGDRQLFLRDFEGACSEGFDPDRDLERIGCANQTTMLSSESMEMADMLHQAMKDCYGEEEARERFRHFDTVCSATQQRQDAVLELVNRGLDIMIVVGGYNSSNTGHLVEIASQKCPTYHVQDAFDILSPEIIRYKKASSREIVETTGWLPNGPVKIGITAGASTPNKVIEEVIRRVTEVTNG